MCIRHQRGPDTHPTWPLSKRQRWMSLSDDRCHKMQHHHIPAVADITTALPLRSYLNIPRPSSPCRQAEVDGYSNDEQTWLFMTLLIRRLMLVYTWLSVELDIAIVKYSGTIVLLLKVGEWAIDCMQNVVVLLTTMLLLGWELKKPRHRVIMARVILVYIGIYTVEQKALHSCC